MWYILDDDLEPVHVGSITTASIVGAENTMDLLSEAMREKEQEVLTKKPNKYIIGQEDVGDMWISTVFLFTDHSFGGPLPVLYETLIFGGSFESEPQYRYNTREEAIIGHQKAVIKCETLWNSSCTKEFFSPLQNFYRKTRKFINDTIQKRRSS